MRSKPVWVPDARMATFPDAPDEVQAEINDLIEIIEASVDEVVRRRRCWRRGTFDSMLVDTRDLLCDEVRGPSIIAELRSRFRLVLVDEFQDTDTVQWKIFRTAFIEQHTGIPAVPLVVVGDPKQSIYRFRGAELSAYLEAVEYADQNGGRRFHLDTNYRSDADMLIALEHVLGQATFGDDRVGFEPVLAGREMSSYGLSGEQPPTQIRSIEPPLDSNGSVDAGTARNWVLADVVAEVVRLLGESRITRKHDALPRRCAIRYWHCCEVELRCRALRIGSAGGRHSGSDKRYRLCARVSGCSSMATSSAKSVASDRPSCGANGCDRCLW